MAKFLTNIDDNDNLYNHTILYYIISYYIILYYIILIYRYYLDINIHTHTWTWPETNISISVRTGYPAPTAGRPEGRASRRSNRSTSGTVLRCLDGGFDLDGHGGKVVDLTSKLWYCNGETDINIYKR